MKKLESYIKRLDKIIMKNEMRVLPGIMCHEIMGEKATPGQETANQSTVQLLLSLWKKRDYKKNVCNSCGT